MVGISARSMFPKIGRRLRKDGVVPFAMEFVLGGVYRAHFLVGDFYSFLVDRRVDLGIDLETRCRGRGANIVDRGFETTQRFASPVDRDIREHFVLDGIPFARSRRIMTDRDRQAPFVGQDLEFDLPQADAIAVAAAAVGRDQNGRRSRVEGFADVRPPEPQRVHGETRRVETDPQNDQTLVLGDVENAVRGRATHVRVDEIIDVDLFRRVLRAPFPAVVLVIADKFFLLAVDGKNRIALRQVILFLLRNV